MRNLVAKKSSPAAMGCYFIVILPGIGWCLLQQASPKQVICCITGNSSHRTVTAPGLGAQYWWKPLAHSRTFLSLTFTPLLCFFLWLSLSGIPRIPAAFTVDFFSFVERAPESHPSVSSSIHAGKVWNVGAAPFSSTQKSQGPFPC